MLGLTNGMTEFDVGDHLDVSSDVQVAVPWYGVVDPLTAKQGSATDALTSFTVTYWGPSQRTPRNWMPRPIH